MDINKLTIRNFSTISNAVLELNNRGLLLLQGVNEDDPSAKSNGAGKSSVPDALFWCLYGETARGVSGDAVVNNKVGKDCHVQTILADGTEKYIVDRYRKDSKNKNALHVHQVSSGTDLTKGTDKETQLVINKILGCSIDVFTSAVYSGQEKMVDLPGSTDKYLKLLIEEAAGVEELAEAYLEARKLLQVANVKLATVSAGLEMANRNKLTAEEGLEVGEGLHKKFEDERKDKARTELAKVLPINTQIDSIKKAMAVFDATVKNARHKELTDVLADYKKSFDHKTTLLNQERRDSILMSSAKTVAEAYKHTWEAEKAKLEDIANQVGKPCGECAKPYCEHDLEAAKKLREESTEKAKAALMEKLKELRAVGEQHAASTKAVNEYEVANVSEVSEELRKLNAEIAQQEVYVRGIAVLERDIDDIKAVARLRMTEANPYAKSVEVMKSRIALYDTEIAESKAKVAEAEDGVELYTDATKVFGPAGVRAHILDTVTPFLNEQTGDYLTTLSDGNIHANWSTLAKTAKGELREKFNIEVTNDHGAKSFQGMSGGEKRKVRLATAMALQDMVASRATKPLNIFVADEIDHALDESGLERLMTVLDKKAKERGTVLVISHNSLSDWIPEVLTVTKSGGFSTISGSTTLGGWV